MSGDSFNPWASIWTQPRATIARIVQENPNRGLWWLAAIYGFSGLLNFFQSMLLGQQFNLIPIFLLALVLGPLWGYVSFSVWSFVIWFTGKWVRGAGNFKAVRAAYAWSCFPFIVNVILWVLLGLLFGRLLFMNAVEGLPPTQFEISVLFGILIVRIAVGIWSLVIYLNALAEVQSFSVLRAIANVIIAGVLIAVFFWLLSTFIFSSMKGMPAQPTAFIPFNHFETLRNL